MKTTDGEHSLSRRRFLGQTVAAGAALAVPWVVPARALGREGRAAASERITYGVIGFGPRCTQDLGNMLAEPDGQCVAVCEVQSNRRESAKALVDGRYGNKDCAVYRDLREMLARKDIDAVLIATGDRWHTPASVLAAKAGKDIYCEKPCAMNIADTAMLADTIHRYGRVFQAGTQRRSIGNFQVAIELVRSGKLGRLHTLHASVYRPSIRYDWLPAEPEPARDVVDWDLWIGPSPWRPYNRQYVAGGWREFNDFCNAGNILDWAAHTVDLCQWANGTDDTTPVEYVPSRDNITARYKNGVTLILDYLNTPFGNRSPHYITRLGTCPVRFEGDEGWVETGDSGDIEVYPDRLRSEVKRLSAFQRTEGIDAGSHIRNFLDCVKTRARTAANPDIMRHSHVACYAAATAWLLNRKVTLDPATESFVGDEEANRLRSRAVRAGWSFAA